MMVQTVSLALRDGVELAVDVYRPDEGEAHPVLLMLTPYGRVNLRMFADFVVPRGYVLVVGDVRGRYDSGGKYDPVRQERRDVPDVIDWVATQKWYDAAAGMGVVGISYLAAVGFIAAALRPEHVRALLNLGGFSDAYDLTHRGGAMVLHHMLPWSILTSFSPQPRLDGADWEEVYRTLPLEEAASRAGFDNELWRQWTAHPEKGEEWRAMDLGDLVGRVDVPTLHISGWYDICLGPTVALYRDFAARCVSPQRLIIGPWSHNGVLMGPTELCGVDFGPESRPDVPGEIMSWFDRHLRGEKTGRRGPAGSPVRVFLTGENRWMEADGWPPSEGHPVDLYMADEGLVWDGPVREGTFSYTYDPARPTPTRGGGVWEFPTGGLLPGPADQTPLHSREDVLVLSSGPLADAISVTGPVSCRLYAATDGETADYTAALLDVAPDGTARILGDGIVRAHLRDDPTAPRPVRRGAVVGYEIDMWSVGHTFRPGHRIGLQVAGANFPKWDRGLNSLHGEPGPARHLIHWGGDNASRVQFYVR